MSRIGGIIILLVSLSSPPGLLQAQSGEHGWGVSLMGLVSATSIDKPKEEDWRGAESWRFRVVTPSRIHFEVAYSYPRETRKPRYCPDLEPSGCITDYGLTDFTLITAGVGYQRTFGRFSPVVGIGGGRMEMNGDSPTAWLAHSGLRARLVENLGLLLDARLSRVNWGNSGVGWNREISLGLWLDLWPGDFRN